MQTTKHNICFYKTIAFFRDMFMYKKQWFLVNKQTRLTIKYLKYFTINN